MKQITITITITLLALLALPAMAQSPGPSAPPDILRRMLYSPSLGICTYAPHICGLSEPAPPPDPLESLCFLYRDDPEQQRDFGCPDSTLSTLPETTPKPNPHRWTRYRQRGTRNTGRAR